MPNLIATPLNQLPGLETRWVRQLEKEGVTTAQEVLQWLPFRHEDRRQQADRGFQPGPVPVCHHVVVTKASTKFFGGRGRGTFEAQVQPAGGSVLGDLLTLRWWNMPFMSRSIVEGMELFIHGRVKEYKGRLSIDHPEYEILKEGDDESAGLHTGRITPVYRLRGGVTQKAVRTAVWAALSHLTDTLAVDLLPTPSARGEFAGWSASRALRTLHFPAEMEALEQARRYLALEEFFTYQLRVVHRRRSAVAAGGQVHEARGELAAQLAAALPFELTEAQQRCLDEIRADMRSTAPMNRLLHGDVGSGKTIVAFFAMLQAIESGAQAALMAPTQILAEQHYQNALKWLAPLGIEIALLTGSKKEGVEAARGARVPQTVTSADDQASPAAESAQDAAPALPPESTLVFADAKHFQRDAENSTRDACAPRDVRYSKRRLPHFERPWGKYFVTFATVGRKPLPPEARQLVLAAILHFHRQRYELYAAVVLEDHAHLLIEPTIETQDEAGEPVFHSLTRILHSIKSFTAHELSKQCLVTAPVWEKESFDRLMRSESELQETYLYILANPSEAGLVSAGESYPYLWMPDAERSARVPRAAEGVSPESLRRQPQTVTRAEDLEPPVAEAAGNSELAPAEKPTPVFADAKHFQRDACAPGNTCGPQLFIGTHALLYERDQMPDLGLVVIDEQHKFGVAQRASLIQKGRTPDVLVMTATPIPRTLTLTVYGDLDVSTIDHRPKARGKVITKVRPHSKQAEAAEFLLTQLELGRQAYLVYPLIEESEKVDAAAAKKGHSEWRKRLPHFNVGLLHGKLSADEKDQIMRDFRSGKHEVLVATTVIEVGVDVPNATVMYLHNAERYGLAQLHQLRGRIGRGTETSYCVLFVNDDDEDAKARLAIMEETNDGFKIAEEDLKRRGPGDMLGRAQSGQGALRFAELLADTRLVRLARQLAERTLEQDPSLSDSRFDAIRASVLQLELPQAMMQ
jgi:RecG-like helicase/REP element-mobilizing transposase RayT